MNVYMARQPIFDRNMNVFGYELLYRKTEKNEYEGYSDEQATAELLNNLFFSFDFTEITNGKKAFINFSEEMLEREIPLLLANEHVVIEILERVQNSDKIEHICDKLKENNYVLALDDFVFNDSYDSLMDYIDIIKIEINTTNRFDQKFLISKYGDKIKFLAEKVETREQFLQAVEMGYEYFQGYFFCEPIIEKGKDFRTVDQRLIVALHELERPEPDFQKLTEVVEMNVELSYKLMKLVNSAFFAAREEIHSIKHGLVRLGLDEIRKWVYLMIAKDIANTDNQEVLITTLVRAKVMELIAYKLNMQNCHLEFFLVGLFSNMDILLGKRMDEVLEELSLSQQVKDSLLKKIIHGTVI